MDQATNIVRFAAAFVCAAAACVIAYYLITLVMWVLSLLIAVLGALAAGAAVGYVIATGDASQLGAKARSLFDAARAKVTSFIPA